MERGNSISKRVGMVKGLCCAEGKNISYSAIISQECYNKRSYFNKLLMSAIITWSAFMHDIVSEGESQ